EGVLAAPEGADPEAWLVLAGAHLDAESRAALQDLRRRFAADRRDLQDTVPVDRAARLAALRRELARRGVEGFLVPRADEHQGEYVPPRAERLAWLTGFTGSAGVAVVLAERAAIFVDGRYTLQVRAEIDPALFEPCHSSEQPPEQWIAAHLPKGAR